MRELFVTINTTAQRVSGHFTVLLNDRTISAMCVRSLADKWKDGEVEPSKLHLLEWNERSDRRANQRNKHYSVTTVSIIANCLRRLFNESTENILKLLERQPDLEGFGDEDYPKYSEINEENFVLKQAWVLEEQVDKYITPSLDVLFFKPTPYKEIWNKFKMAVDWLDGEVENRGTESACFKNQYLYKFRTVTKRDNEQVNVVCKQFEKLIEEDQQKSVFFKMVFQQGLIRAWYDLSIMLCREFKVDPKHIANALVESLEVLCFDTSKGYFNDRNAYLQQVIYKGQRVLVNDKAKDCWVYLILSLFKDENTRHRFIEVLNEYNGDIEEETLSSKLLYLADDGIRKYFNILEGKIRDDISLNWKYKDYDKSILDFLISRESVDEESAKKEFKVKIESLVDDKMCMAQDQFANVYKLSTKTIF